MPRIYIPDIITPFAQGMRARQLGMSFTEAMTAQDEDFDNAAYTQMVKTLEPDLDVFYRMLLDNDLRGALQQEIHILRKAEPLTKGRTHWLKRLANETIAPWRERAIQLGLQEVLGTADPLAPDTLRNLATWAASAGEPNLFTALIKAGVTASEKRAKEHAAKAAEERTRTRMQQEEELQPYRVQKLEAETQRAIAQREAATASQEVQKTRAERERLDLGDLQAIPPEERIEAKRRELAEKGLVTGGGTGMTVFDPLTGKSVAVQGIPGSPRGKQPSPLELVGPLQRINSMAETLGVQDLNTPVSDSVDWTDPKDNREYTITWADFLSEARILNNTAAQYGFTITWNSAHKRFELIPVPETESTEESEDISVQEQPQNQPPRRVRRVRVDPKTGKVTLEDVTPK